MPIVDSDFVWRQPLLISNSTPAQNGGRMATAVITNGTKNNLFPDASQSERSAGSVKFRKAFIHVGSSQNLELLDSKVYISQATPADDFVTIHPGTQTDTEDTMTGRAYGVATLSAPVSASDTEISLVPENEDAYDTLLPFKAGDLIRIADATNEEWKIIDSVTYGATIDVVLTTALSNDYVVLGTLVSSCYEVPSVIASISDVVKTSTAGNANTALIVANNKGALHDTITVTFTSATAFTVAGPSIGTLGSGTVSSTFSPNNVALGAAYFSIPSSVWSGTWAANDTLVFKLNPAAIPIWYRREIPAGSGVLSNNSVIVSIYGESA